MLRVLWWGGDFRALRVMRISLLAGEMRTMHLSSSGALLSGAASIRLYQLVASVLTLLFTTSAIVRSPLCSLQTHHVRHLPTQRQTVRSFKEFKRVLDML